MVEIDNPKYLPPGVKFMVVDQKPEEDVEGYALLHKTLNYTEYYIPVNILEKVE